MPNVVNKMVVRQMEGTFQGVDGMVVVSLDGLTVPESEGLRNSLAEKGVRLLMVRNTLARRALESAGIDIPADVFQGTVAIACGGAEEAIHAAKVLTEPEVKKAGKVQVKAGMLQGNVLDAGDTAALADIPDRDTLNAQILGCISGPARSLVSILSAPGGALARVVQAHVDAEGGVSE